MESKNIYEKNIKTAVDLFIAQMKLEGWLPIKEYFSIKKLVIELDWVIVLTMDHNGFIAKEYFGTLSKKTLARMIRKWNIPSGYMVECTDRYGNEIKVSVK